MKKIYSALFLSLLFVNSVQAQVTYTGKPKYKIDVKRAGTYIGSIHIELFPNLAYHHTRNFDSLVGQSFYDTTAFHRVIPGFMIQGGDPNSRHGATSTWGYGQAGQPTVDAEFSTAKHVRGILSAARSNNINSATSQFFICVATASNLDGNYSVYGRVTSGMDIVDTIVKAPRNSNNLPNLKHEMFITAIGSNDSVPIPPVLTHPANNAYNINAETYVQLKWNKVSDAIEYEIEVSEDPSFTDLFASGKSGTNNFYLTTLKAEDTKYYWHVRTNNGGHYSEWSSDFVFSTEHDVGIADNAAMQNINIYPNPSTGVFNFSAVKPGYKLQVCDVNGKIILETKFTEDTYELNLEGKAKGIYSYSIEGENKATLKGKLLLK